ncbi:MAG: pyruvate kinase [Planctomycetota bacterium]
MLDAHVAVPTPAAAVLRRILELRDAALALEDEHAGELEALHPDNRASGANLLHYLAIRRHDLRSLQVDLVALGLSSLGRCEAHVLPTLDALLAVLSPKGPAAPSKEASGGAFPGNSMDGGSPPRRASRYPMAGVHQGRATLERNTVALLGSPRSDRDVRIMVTADAGLAAAPQRMQEMLLAGMDLLRINCAHDGLATWAAMLGHLTTAHAAGHGAARVLMDLGGPKLRTGAFAPGPCVLKLRPTRDRLGRVLVPARALLTPSTEPELGDGTLPRIPVDEAWLDRLEVGDLVHLHDARGRKRRLLCERRIGSSVVVATDRTCYLVPGTVLRCSVGERSGPASAVGDLPALEGELPLRVGDRLQLTAQVVECRTPDAGGMATVTCTLPEVFAYVRAGQPVWFDDGRIGGVIEAVEGQNARIRITSTPPKGARLRADKGINLPDTAFEHNGLTLQDRADLRFVAQHADAVSLSFLDRPQDVVDLQRALTEEGRSDLAIVLKIETKRGFERLPRILLAAMRSPHVGVMIARGDLAVECGFERLAEVQEEMLWLCEAAHVPAIWATQVLDNLARNGLPTRAEVTDAAMAVRAECVMLNKGPHIVSAIRILDGILRRMAGHQYKKRAMLRPLRVSFF